MGDLWIEPRPAWCAPSEAIGRAEGVAISRCGRFLAVAQAHDGRVVLLERVAGPDGYEARPIGSIGGPRSGVDYPHDVDFSPDGRLLVVANRASASLTFYARKPGAAAGFGEEPVWTVARRRGRLAFTDAVKFVPPRGRYVAAANLARHSVTFYRRGLLRRSRYGRKPCFVLEGSATRLVEPDGLAFTSDGALLAVTNHGGHTVTVYARRGRAPRYGPAPVAEIGGSPSRLRYPHSVAFSPSGTHLAISNAGGREVTVYRRETAARGDGSRWSAHPVLALEACDPARFDGMNRERREEGGSKGIAFGADCFAVCNEAFGLRVHRAGFDGGRA